MSLHNAGLYPRTSATEGVEVVIGDFTRKAVLEVIELEDLKLRNDYALSKIREYYTKKGTPLVAVTGTQDPVIVVGVPDQAFAAFLAAEKLTLVSNPGEDPKPSGIQSYGRKPNSKRELVWEARSAEVGRVYVVQTPPGRDYTRAVALCAKAVDVKVQYAAFFPDLLETEVFLAWSGLEALSSQIQGSYVVLGAVNELKEEAFAGDHRVWWTNERELVESESGDWNVEVVEKPGVLKAAYLSWRRSFWGDLARPLGRALFHLGAKGLFHAGAKVGVLHQFTVHHEIPLVFAPEKFYLVQEDGSMDARIDVNNCLSQGFNADSQESHFTFPSALDERQDRLAPQHAVLGVQSVDLEGAHFALAAAEAKRVFGAVYWGSDRVVIEENMVSVVDGGSLTDSVAAEKKLSLKRRCGTSVRLYFEHVAAMSAVRHGPLYMSTRRLLRNRVNEFMQGTREHLFAQISDWCGRTDLGFPSRVLGIVGKAGTGKTVLLAEMCRLAGLLAASNGREANALSFRVAAFSVFNSFDSDTQDLARVMQSISNQMAETIERFVVDNTSDVDEKNLLALFDHLIRRPALQASEVHQDTAVIVIDGLDECDEHKRGALLDIIQKRWGTAGSMPTWLKLIFSTRELEPYQMIGFERINLDRATNETDMRICFMQLLRKYDVPQSEEVEAINLLLDRADGEFLYVRLLESRWSKKPPSINSSFKLSALRSELRDRQVVYKLCFDRIYEAMNSNKDLFDLVFGTILCARQYLPVTVWAQICGYSFLEEVEGSDEEYDSEGEFDDSLESITAQAWFHAIEWVVTIADGVVRLAHKAYESYLRKTTNKAHLIEQQDRRGHESIVHWCEKHSDHDFAMTHRLYHLIHAQRFDQLERLFCEDIDWLQRAVKHLTMNGQDSEKLSNLWNDVKLLPGKKHVKTVAAALRLSKDALMYKPEQLFAQLHQRLPVDHPLSPVIEAKLRDYRGLIPIAPKGWVLEAAQSGIVDVLTYHSSAVRLARFGKLKGNGFENILATCSDDSQVVIWDVDSGQLLAKPLLHDQAVKHICFSPDCSKLASGTEDGLVRLWDVKTGTFIRSLTKHTTDVGYLSFMDNNSTLLSFAVSDAVRVVDLSREASWTLFRIPDSWHVRDMAFCLSRRLIAFGCCMYRSGRPPNIALLDDIDWNLRVPSQTVNAVKLWDYANKELLWTCDVGISTGKDCPLCFSSKGELLVAAAMGELKVWDLESYSEIQCYDINRLGCAHCLSMSKDDALVVTGHDTVLGLWSLDSDNDEKICIGHRYPITSVDFSCKGLIASSSLDCTTRLWDAQNIDLDSPATNSALTRFCISPDGKTIVTGHNSGSIRLWQSFTFEELYHVKPHDVAISCIAVSGDGQLVASGSNDGIVLLWDMRDRELEQRIRVCTYHSSVSSLCFSQDDTKLLCGSSRLHRLRFGPCIINLDDDFLDSECVRVYDIVNTCCYQISECCREVAALQDLSNGQILVVWRNHLSGDALWGKSLPTDDDTTLEVWDIDARELVQTVGKVPYVDEISLSSDETVIAFTKLVGSASCQNISIDERGVRLFGNKIQLSRSMYDKPTFGVAWPLRLRNEQRHFRSIRGHLSIPLTLDSTIDQARVRYCGETGEYIYVLRMDNRKLVVLSERRH